MPINRQFLTWNQPLLPQAASWLIRQRDRPTGPVHLSDWLVVVPVAAARSRLRELLVFEADGKLLAPEILTPSELPERLYRVKKPFASEYTQQMAWRRALQQVDPELLSNVVPNAPPASAFREWLALADLLAGQHRELAADGLDFQAVAAQGPALSHFPERERWDALGKIEATYLTILDGLGLWDRQEARLFAVRNEECRSSRPIALIGTSDLNAIVRRMLDQLVSAPHGGSVTALVHAPEDERDAFDDHGCLKVADWQDRPIPIEVGQIIVSDGPGDEAEDVGVAIAQLDGSYAADDIAISCPDDRSVPTIQRRLREAGVGSHWMVGRSLDRSRPGRLLVALADHLDRPSAATTLAILHHPDILALVEQSHRDSVLPQLNEYRSWRYPRLLREDAVLDVPNPDEFASAAAGIRLIDSLVEPIASNAKRTVGSWADAFTQVLATVYGSAEFDRDRPADAETLLAIERIRSLSHEFSRCPASLDMRIHSGDALRVLLSALSEQTGPAVADADDANSVALAGWLEMPLDDRPVAIITSFNEGVIPTSVTSDLFLPGRLRQHLGLNDNERRYARDAYAMTVILKSRDVVRAIVPRSDVEGNPLAPSRLLFTDSPEASVATFAALLGARPPRQRLPTVWTPRTKRWGVPVPSPNGLATEQSSTPVSLSVTAFRDYIACPYRFYLKHILRLRPSAPVDDELTAASFGSMIHVVLSRFGREAIKESRDAERITEFVRDVLQSYATAMFGSSPLPAIQVQIRKAEQRLRHFAEQQAIHRGNGWHVSYAETDEVDHRDMFRCEFNDRDNVLARLRGRIDRIDRHDDGSWLILDYKTGDKGKEPEDAHLKGPKKDKDWVDLQLPMYRHLATDIGVTGAVETGYFNLPESTEKAGVQMSGFDDVLLERADDRAREILASIRLGEFTISDRTPAFDDFAAICQSDVLQVGPPSQNQGEGDR